MQVCLLMQKTRTTLIRYLKYHQPICNLQTGTHLIFLYHLENAIRLPQGALASSLCSYAKDLVLGVKVAQV